MMTLNIKDDGLIIAEVGAWSKRKYKLISQYAEMFSTSMKNKWDYRIYIDCFAGCGYSKIKGTSTIVPASPILALEIPDKFDQYIFCDIDKIKLGSLKKRIENKYPDTEVYFINNDVNCSVDKIVNFIPRPSRTNRVLSFCVLDPYNINNLCFNTIENLAAKIFVDFLILIPSYMDANRNLQNYYHNKSIDNFLGDSKWRETWEENKNSLRFGRFIVEEFNKRMISRGFLGLEPEEFVEIREQKRKCPLYHLAFYSKNNLGKKFWKAAIKGSNPQIALFN